MSLEEIEAEPGYKPDSPVTQKNYVEMLGFYDIEVIVSCCHKKESEHLCKQMHGFGIVTKDTDGTVSVIGNSCAHNHFDADTNLRRDVRLATNERDRLKRLISVRKLIAEKDLRLSKIKEMTDQAVISNDQLKAFLNPIGTDIKSTLQAMHKADNPTITITTVHKRVGLDEHGEERTETDRLSRSIGQVKGLEVFNRHRMLEINNKRIELEQTYAKLDAISDDITSAKLTALQNDLKIYDDIVSGYQGRLKAIARFLTNDLNPFCFLTTNFSERKALAKHILEQMGDQHGGDKAKDHIRMLENQLKEQYQADRIEIDW